MGTERAREEEKGGGRKVVGKAYTKDGGAVSFIGIQ